MTFKDIVLKNFKFNVRNYLSYFLCTTFSIMLFFIYATMLTNKALVGNGDGMENFSALIFYISLVAIGAFSIFFINYAHTSFIKTRYKEFGVYMTLGMTSKDIQKIILLENLAVMSASLVTGVFSGVIFSRLFQMVVLSLLKIKDITYSLDILSFASTIGFFSLVFILVIFFSRRKTSKLEIGDLLKKSRKNETEIKPRLIPLLVGVTILVASIVALVIMANDKKLVDKFILVLPTMMVMIIGVYITINYLGVSILAITKKRKNTYYNNILLVTETAMKFNQDKKITFLLSILSSMIVFLVASSFALYSMVYRITDEGQPYDIEFASVCGINNISDNAIDRACLKSGTTFTKADRIEFLSAMIPNPDKTDYLGGKPVISQSTYNKYVTDPISVPKGKVFNAITFWMPGDYGITPGSMLTLTASNGNMLFEVMESVKSKWVSAGLDYPSNSGMIINDEDYKLLKEKSEAQDIGTYYLFKVKDWTNSQEFLDALNVELDLANQELPDDKKALTKLVVIQSKLNSYNSLKSGYSVFMFVTTIMGLLFFIAAGSVLFFKQYAEIGDAKQKFYKLFKLGITKKEAKKLISRELLLTFFSPMIFGTLMGYVYIYFMTCLVGGDYVLGEFMQKATIVVLAYFVFQTFFYIITRKKYSEAVI